jgi:putative ubiquitin-RnfH superfamily antitoxin RatB of RatAB toxin-antitoxin module
VKIEVMQAWPRHFQSTTVELPDGTTVADAIAAAGLTNATEVAGYAIFGVIAETNMRLRDGDRVELLRPLLADPKETRRRRARKPKT